MLYASEVRKSVVSFKWKFETTFLYSLPEVVLFVLETNDNALSLYLFDHYHVYVQPLYSVVAYFADLDDTNSKTKILLPLWKLISTQSG